MDPATAMFHRDQASRLLGVELLEVWPGGARARLRVAPELLNGHGTVHGGVVFLLADTAFGCACNGEGDDAEHTIASASIEYLRPAHVGDLLVAEAQRRSREGRSGVYDVTVRNDTEVIAEFRGRSHRRGRVS
jgi:acyl-CoA thioesterase